MSEVKITNASSIRKGSYIVIDGEAYQVKSEPQLSKPGKHGHAKVRIKAGNIITGAVKEIVKPGHDNVEVPIILKKKGQVLSISDTIIELMDMETYENLTANKSIIEESLVDKIEIGQIVLFWKVMNQIIIKELVEEN